MGVAVRGDVGVGDKLLLLLSSSSALSRPGIEMIPAWITHELAVANVTETSGVARISRLKLSSLFSVPWSPLSGLSWLILGG